MSEIKKIDLYSGCIVKLHKQLKEEDKVRSQLKAEKRGEKPNTSPIVAIDLSNVVSVQEDYRTGGTLLTDKKAAIAVIEPFDDVFEVWVYYKKSMQK